MAERVRPGCQYRHFDLPSLTETENVSGERSPSPLLFKISTFSRNVSGIQATRVNMHHFDFNFPALSPASHFEV